MFWFFGCEACGISLTRDWIHIPCIGRGSLNHWTVSEVPQHIIFEHFLPPSTRCLKYILFFSCSRPRVSHFSDQSYFFLMNNGVWKPRYRLRCASTVIGASLSKAFSMKKVGNKCKYVTYTHFISSLPHTCIETCEFTCAVLKSLSCVRLFTTPWTIACQAPLSMGILQTRMLEWVAMPSSRESSNPGFKSRSLLLQAYSLPSEPPGKPCCCCC